MSPVVLVGTTRADHCRAGGQGPSGVLLGLAALAANCKWEIK